VSGSDVLTRLHVQASGAFAFERWQDCEDIVERNKALQSIPQYSDWARHVASIPCVLLEKWLNEEYERGNVSLRMFSEEFNAVIARKLRDPDWAFLRTDNPSNPFRIGWGPKGD
jgi:hypothetical protein